MAVLLGKKLSTELTRSGFLEIRQHPAKGICALCLPTEQWTVSSTHTKQHTNGDTTESKIKNGKDLT